MTLCLVGLFVTPEVGEKAQDQLTAGVGLARQGGRTLMTSWEKNESAPVLYYLSVDT